jgi:hypothetical protein
MNILKFTINFFDVINVRVLLIISKHKAGKHMTITSVGIEQVAFIQKLLADKTRPYMMKIIDKGSYCKTSFIP